MNAIADATLNVALSERFLPVATSFAEHAATALGLGARESLRLTLAAEEVFSHLAKVARRGEMVRVEAASGGYFVRLSFRFETRGLDLAGLNLTASFSPESDADLEQLGLLLASRSVDRFEISEDHPKGHCLTMIQERHYPPALAGEPPPSEPMTEFKVDTASEGDLKLMAAMLPVHYDPLFYVPGFVLPGKLADMARSGEYRVFTATDSLGHLGGALVLRFRDQRIVRALGPYLFNQPKDSAMPEALFEAALGSVAKSDALGLLCTLPTDSLPVGWFEKLGVMDFQSRQGPRSIPLFYRQLKEDAGLRTWSHPGMAEFLNDQYRKLFLPRNLILTSDQGEERARHSVLAADFQRNESLVTLRPMWDGGDFGENLARHLEALQKEGALNILFEMDLALPWQANLAPDLMANGFEPRVILPNGGTGDLAVFQHMGG